MSHLFPRHCNIAPPVAKTGEGCYPMAGTRDGKQGDHILLAPPFIITGEQIPEIVVPLQNAVQNVISGL